MIPLRQEPDGALRVGKSRVLLELVVAAFDEGATPEEICQRYDTLQLGDVYAVIGYYLGHRQEIDTYLRSRAQAAHRVRQEIEAAQPPRPGLRAQLLARQAARENNGASPGV